MGYSAESLEACTFISMNRSYPTSDSGDHDQGQLNQRCGASENPMTAPTYLPTFLPTSRSPMSRQRAESHGTAGGRSIKRSHGRAPEVTAENVKHQGIPRGTRLCDHFQEKPTMRQIRRKRRACGRVAYARASQNTKTPKNTPCRRMTNTMPRMQCF